jgi:hypothetical protein
VVQVVEHQPSKHEALSLNASTAKKKKKKVRRISFSKGKYNKMKIRNKITYKLLTSL